ncbi:iron-sulfur cluster assembly protein SufC [Plasmodium brasilianum]|uniref:FeS assembly ATPase SufC, putative n=2 Tax=Plasmodium (Plasmodium) TaxID=418103 RepID=A0A1A8WCK3_PLAMA|nr:ABC transporter I family member 1, putative [Plasmodium malariae]KAI4835866.1 iron-sulfur cluster assembly protein SufC [Plasmodium brasilianum]SBS89745.1 FeS assembly ATPase SufC, putative (SufC) [Plasmodium malariae]SCP02802.1 ABC transporter I family member 1, putative [Plasmodium malariae]
MRVIGWITIAYGVIAHFHMTTCIHFLERARNNVLLKNRKSSLYKLEKRQNGEKRMEHFFVINKIKNRNMHRRNSVNMENSNMDNNRLALLKNLEDETKIITQSPEWNEKMPLIEINNLHAIEIEGGKEILKGINLSIYLGEKHAIMGRNGSGKSTLTKVIAGHPYYKVTDGNMKFKGLDLNTLAVNVRSLCGIFLAFQYPIELPMVKNNEFLRAALNSHRKHRNESEISASEFDLLMIEEIKKVGLTSEFLDRPVNYGFSGGEKKRNEILQMLILKPSFCILDETDSGLDVDSFKLTSNVITNFSNQNNSFLIVTHYKKLLELLKPNFIHIMHQGKIIETGDYSIVDKVESKGYSQFVKD